MSEPRDEEPPIESPPEGASCPEHPEQPAVVTCPRCGSYACLSCWHDPIRRCHACLMRDPAAAGDPVAWEDDRRGFVSRFLGTLAAAFAPARSAPGFARGEIGPGVAFLLLTFVPIALASGIVPYTARLLFEPVFAFRTIGTPTDAELAADIAKAAVIGLVVWSVQVLVLGTSYASLVRAYLHKGHAAAPARVILYRAWLLPMTMLWMDLAVLVTDQPEVLQVLQYFSVVPLVLLIAAMISTARMGGGVGRIASVIVVLVPVAVMVLSESFVLRALQPLLPDSEAIRAAAEAAPPE